MMVITNNESVLQTDSHEVEFVKGDAFDVLKRVRDCIHLGHRLLSYPLGASIKMLHSPIVSVVVEPKMGAVDAVSLEVIEDSIARLEAIMGERPFDWRNQKDYERIDQDRLQAAYRELNVHER